MFKPLDEDIIVEVDENVPKDFSMRIGSDEDLNKIVLQPAQQKI